MEWFETVQINIALFLLIFARISGIFSTAPLFGAKNVPVMVKSGLAILMAILVLPLVGKETVSIPGSFFLYSLIAIGEFLIGLIYGYLASLIFSAIQMTGFLLDTQIGFGIVNILDPQFQQQIPLVGNFKYIIAMLVFLAINGHHMLLTGIVNSYQVVEIGTGVFRPEMASFMTNIVVSSFIIAVKLSLPVLIALLLTDLGLGILARTMPQMNIFVVGIPGKIFVGIFMLYICLPFYVAFLEVLFHGLYKDLLLLLQQFKA